MQSLIVNRAPTAGGQYHWVSEFAPRKYQKILSYTSGQSISLPVLHGAATDYYIGCKYVVTSVTICSILRPIPNCNEASESVV